MKILKTKNFVALAAAEIIKVVLLLLIVILVEAGDTLSAATSAQACIGVIMIAGYIMFGEERFKDKTIDKNTISVLCAELFLGVLVMFTPLFYVYDPGEVGVFLTILLFIVVLFALSCVCAGITAFLFRFLRNLQEYQEAEETPKETPKKAPRKKAKEVKKEPEITAETVEEEPAEEAGRWDD